MKPVRSWHLCVTAALLVLQGCKEDKSAQVGCQSNADCSEPTPWCVQAVCVPSQVCGQYVSGDTWDCLASCAATPSSTSVEATVSACLSHCGVPTDSPGGAALRNLYQCAASKCTSLGGARSCLEAAFAGDCKKEYSACACTATASIDNTCDGIDNDCDGETDEDVAAITCGKGACVHTVDGCVNGKPATCDPMQGASAETCNGVDDDCDGTTDEDLGTQACGVGACARTLQNCEGGVPVTCDPMAGATAEACNGVDDDCDGTTDEDLGTQACGVGACARTLQNCEGGGTGHLRPDGGRDSGDMQRHRR